MEPTSLAARPYRSHKLPACDRCRARKSRCDIDVTGESCRFCRERGFSCDFTQRRASPQPESPAPTRPAKRQRTDHGSSINRHPRSQVEGSLAQFPSINGTSPTESSLMMNPPMSEDIAILEQYLTSQTVGGEATAKPYSTISSASGNPVVYLTVPRKRKGLRSAVDPGKTQREIIEQVLHPYTSEVRKL